MNADLHTESAWFSSAFISVYQRLKILLAFFSNLFSL